MLSVSETELERMSDVLRELRWLVNSLQLSGLGYYPVGHRATASMAVTAEAAPEAPNTVDIDAAAALTLIEQDLGDCRRCRLHEARTHIVFGDGSAHAQLVFVGEAPGFDEDRQGKPFVGRAGKLLDKMIQALGRTRKEVYICNVIKCRPPQNRNPNSDEIATCSPFLFRQLEAIRPKAICALGAFAVQTLLQTTKPISQLRGKTQYWRGIPVVPTFHPAYLLRNPAQKAQTWLDLLQVINLIDSKSRQDTAPEGC